MEDYIGKYRVVCEFDRRKLKPCPDDNYIYCANKGQIYRFNDSMLVYYKPGRNQAEKTIKQLKAVGIEVLKDGSTSEDILIHFREEDLERVAEIFKARTKGVNIKPASRKNLKLFDWYIAQKRVSKLRKNASNSKKNPEKVIIPYEVENRNDKGLKSVITAYNQGF